MSELVLSRCFGFSFAPRSRSFPVVIPEVEFLRPSRHRILPRSSNEVRFKRWFVLTRGWELEGQDQDSRVVYRSHSNEIKTPTWAESSGPMMGHLILDSLHSRIVRLTEPRSLLTLWSKGYAKL